MSQVNSPELPGAIAIVGLAGRFPQAKNLEAFWRNLKDGREVVTFFSAEELLAAGVDPELVKDPNYVPARAILEDAEQFDAAFFGYSAREAEIIDPQQRLFLECAWEALEHAGYDPERYAGPIGVYGGLSMNAYLINNLLANAEALASMGGYQIMLGNDKDFLTTRVSYKLGLKGPSVNVQTACSTSLVAVQLACQSLLNCQCDLALAGGVSISSPRKAGYLYQPGMIMSPDGHCRAFDHRAQGIVAGEGVGLVVLKRYAEAVQEGDTIHAIIRGSAINNDGALKMGYTAPSVDGQTEVILMAQSIAGVEPDSITYIEAHGTGTELGDPIEISALTQAFRTGTQAKGFCGIGSAKTHMGHLDAAAGVAGLIKTVLALKDKTLPPNLNFEKPNPHIDFEHSPFYVNASAKVWKTDRLPRRAGVSSFGIGGTNAHVIVEEASPSPAGQPRRPEQLLLLSARSEYALNAAGMNLAAWLRQNTQASLADAAYTLQMGRKVFKHRRFLVAGSSGEAVTMLEGPGMKPGMEAQQESKDARVVFLFPGQGAQYVNMGLDLYQGEPFFREQVDHCIEILKPHLGFDLHDALYPGLGGEKPGEERLQPTWIAQPALFTIEYSLAKLWMAWGIQPQAMVGHSIGEYVAACLAGVFSLEDGLALVAARGKMMQAMPGGSMLSVSLAEPEILPLLGDNLSLAAINAPQMCVVSGPHEAIEALQKTLTAREVACRRLHTSHAFHSAMMEPILSSFTDLVSKVSRHAPEIPYLSNLTGGWITADQATSPAYWATHLRSTVRFAQNAEALAENSPILLEVGPGQSLGTLARQHTGRPAQQAILASMRHPQEPSSDTAFITNTLGRLWLSGVSPDWQAYHSGETLHRVPLPTYPFERKRYWLEPKKQLNPHSDTKLSVSKRTDLATWFYLPSWQRSGGALRDCEPIEKANWLVLSDALGVGPALTQQLEAAGHHVIQVRLGEAFAQTGECAYTMRPEAGAHYMQLLKTLSSLNVFPTRIVHLWTLTAEPPRTFEALQEMQTRGFYSLLALAQAFGEREKPGLVQMVVVSNHLHEVTGGEALSAAKATLLGPCKVIPQECPNLACRSVDVVLPNAPIDSNSALLSQILAEFTGQASEPVVAYRGAYRWIQTYLPRPQGPVSSTQLPLREQGVYLVTGGYGGIGLALAGYLAQAVRARLVLIGRSGLPERSQWPAWLDHHAGTDRISHKIRAIQELEKSGASVLLLTADVTDLGQMHTALEQARKQFGRINGVIHAAGVAGGGLIQLKSEEKAAGVLSPKVQGTWILDHILEGEPLDFCVLCSSINAIVGGGGQVDYSAANAFLDAFAHMENASRNSSRFISVNWTAWQEVGMAVETEVPAHLQRWKEENLRLGIHPSEGIEIFRRILANPTSQVVVSPLDIFGLLERAWGQTESKGDGPEADIARAPSGQPSKPESHDDRPEMKSTYTPPESEIEKWLVKTWQNLIGVEPIGIHDNFFELGGHSLLATQILSRIRDCYKIELPLRVFFEANTVAELGKRIEALVWLGGSQPTADAASEGREEITL